MRKLIAALTLALLVAGCGAKEIRPDPSEPATQANFHSAEFQACGQLFNGIGICEIEKGVNLDTLKLKVQGYFKGAITVATTCPIADKPPTSTRYDNSLLWQIPLNGPALQTCGITFLVSPEFPDEANQPVEISSLKGHLLVRVIERGQEAFPFLVKSKEGVNPSEVITMKSSAREAEVFLKSTACSLDFHKKYEVSGGLFVLKVKDFFPTMPMKTCPIEGVVFFDNVPQRVAIFLDGYSRTFNPLAIPAVTVKDAKINITAGDQVAALSVDDQYLVNYTGQFKFDPAQPHIVRAITVRGRLALGQYSPKTKAFKWIQ